MSIRNLQHLLSCLLDDCTARGAPLVAGIALPENSRMQALAAALGFTLDSGADGSVRVRRSLCRSP